jgi:hypothetical protein
MEPKTQPRAKAAHQKAKIGTAVALERGTREGKGAAAVHAVSLEGAWLLAGGGVLNWLKQ